MELPSNIGGTDLPSKSFGAMVEDRPLMNSTLAFFGGETSVESMLEIIGV